MIGLDLAAAIVFAEDTVDSVPVALITIIPATITAVASFLAFMYSRRSSKELKPNGGGSTKDAVLRVDNHFAGAVETFTRSIESVNARLDGFDARLQNVEHHVTAPVQVVAPTDLAVEPVTAHPATTEESS